MPWCDDCSKFWNPNSMPPDGTCPTCGRVIAEPPDTKVPWHFWLLLAAATVYLGWRAVQGVVWFADRGQPVAAAALALAIVGVVLAAGIWWLRGRRAAGGEGDAGVEEPGGTDDVS